MQVRGLFSKRASDIRDDLHLSSLYKGDAERFQLMVEDFMEKFAVTDSLYIQLVLVPEAIILMYMDSQNWLEENDSFEAYYKKADKQLNPFSSD